MAFKQYAFKFFFLLFLVLEPIVEFLCSGFPAKSCLIKLILKFYIFILYVYTRWWA